MNTKQAAIEQLHAFFTSADKFLFFNGTYQGEKHPLAISAASQFTTKPSTILFRSNHTHHTGEYLQAVGIQKPPKPGGFIRLNSHLLRVDTINRRSWTKTPRQIDIAIVYPIDSLDADKGRECVQDLVGRDANKICLVTWTDNRDFSWVEKLNPVRITYDAEAERPDYHQRVRDCEEQGKRMTERGDR